MGHFSGGAGARSRRLEIMEEGIIQSGLEQESRFGGGFPSRGRSVTVLYGEYSVGGEPGCVGKLTLPTFP